MSIQRNCLAAVTLSGFFHFAAAASEPPPPVASLVAAESEFAAHAVATDMRQAFIRALGTDGILLRPGPVAGAAFMAARPIPPIELNWRPSFAYAAASGDIGITSGPWRILSRTNPATPPAYGHFTSLWKRNAAGRWMLAFDTGISHPDASGTDAFLLTPATTMHRATPAAVDATIKRFTDKVSTTDYSTAVKSFAAADIRFYRDRSAPRVGRAAIDKLDAQWTRHRLAGVAAVSGVASSNDLVYRLFEIRPETGNGVVAHSFTVWRATADGGVELILDVGNDMPAKTQSAQ